MGRVGDRPLGFPGHVILRNDMLLGEMGKRMEFGGRLFVGAVVDHFGIVAFSRLAAVLRGEEKQVDVHGVLVVNGGANLRARPLAQDRRK